MHVSRPHARGVAQWRGVVTHGRSVSAEDVVTLHGIPTTSIERTREDVATRLSCGMVKKLVVAGEGIVKHPWTAQGRQPPLTDRGAAAGGRALCRT